MVLDWRQLVHESGAIFENFVELLNLVPTQQNVLLGLPYVGFQLLPLDGVIRLLVEHCFSRPAAPFQHEVQLGMSRERHLSVLWHTVQWPHDCWLSVATFTLDQRFQTYVSGCCVSVKELSAVHIWVKCKESGY